QLARGGWALDGVGQQLVEQGGLALVGRRRLGRSFGVTGLEVRVVVRLGHDRQRVYQPRPRDGGNCCLRRATERRYPRPARVRVIARAESIGQLPCSSSASRPPPTS